MSGALHPLSYEAICGERARREDAWALHRTSPATTPDPLWRWHPTNKTMGFLRGSLMSKQPSCSLCRKEIAPTEEGWGEATPLALGWCDGTCESEAMRRADELDLLRFDVARLTQQLDQARGDLARVSKALHIAIHLGPPRLST